MGSTGAFAISRSRRLRSFGVRERLETQGRRSIWRCQLHAAGSRGPWCRRAAGDLRHCPERHEMINDTGRAAMRSKSRSFRAIAAAALLVAAFASAASAQERWNRGQNVQPVFEGWERNDDGSFTMVFGYLNRNYEEQPVIPVGPNNRFEPGPADRGQPTHFYNRRQQFVFTVRVPADWGREQEPRVDRHPQRPGRPRHRPPLAGVGDRRRRPPTEPGVGHRAGLRRQPAPVRPPGGRRPPRGHPAGHPRARRPRRRRRHSAAQPATRRAAGPARPEVAGDSRPAQGGGHRPRRHLACTGGGRGR